MIMDTSALPWGENPKEVFTNSTPRDLSEVKQISEAGPSTVKL
jgi:hypothetical protein